MRWCAWVGCGVAIAAVGCSDYELTSKPDPPPMPHDSGTTPPPYTPPPPPPSCDDVVLPDLMWVGSEPFTEEADPVDASGAPFYDAGSDRSAWTAVTIPDLTIPIGYDRAYASAFVLAEIPLNLSFELQSDDGIVLWVNGVGVGQWGGAWQTEGCVNEHANCLVTTTVAPVDVTGLLVEGENFVAARVSNPVLNAYFEIVPRCVQ